MENDVTCDVPSEYCQDGRTARKPCGIVYVIGQIVPCNHECYEICKDNFYESKIMQTAKKVFLTDEH